MKVLTFLEMSIPNTFQHLWNYALHFILLGLKMWRSQEKEQEEVLRKHWRSFALHECEIA